MANNLNAYIDLLKKDLRLVLSIGFGIFLFILFFEPIPLYEIDFNNRLLLITGFGTIMFIFSIALNVFLSFRKQGDLKKNTTEYFPRYLAEISFIILSATACTFYIHYVGKVRITFFIVFKILLIIISALAILKGNTILNELKVANKLLVKQNKSFQKKIETYENDYLNRSVEFYSENKTEKINLLIADVAFIKSADNYIEITFKENGKFKTKLVRNSLKNIETQIAPYSNFIRCHRTCIVNTHFVEKINRNYNNHSLSIKGYPDPVPVSRQYLIKIKEIL